MTPTKFTNYTISIVKHIANNYRMIATATILCVIFLLTVGTIQTARFGVGHSCCVVLVVAINICRYIRCK